MTIFQYIKEIFRDKTDPVLFEIGSYRCEDTYDIILNAGLRGKQFKYFAFEPDPKNIDEAKKSLAYKYINLIEAAVGPAIGRARFHQSSGNVNPSGESWTGSGSLLTPKNHLEAFPWCKFETSLIVDVVDLDSFCSTKKIDHIDFVWCDTQGNEGNVVAGGQEIFKNVHYFYTEYNDHEMYEKQPTLNELIALLPGKWELIEQWPHDVLLRNEDYKRDL